MAELQHDRILGETVTQTFAFDGGAPLEAAAFVSIRLWLDRPSQSSGQILRESLNPAVCLAVDTLVASGGKVVTDRGGGLLVSFADVFSSILGARRLQWAFEGLSEASQFAGVAAAVVVHSSQDLPSGITDAAMAGPLENALPGQVLLSEAMCRALADLHVMSCESTNDAAFRALNWRQTGAGTDNAADEQTLFRNIKELGFSNARASARQANDALESLTAAEEAGLAEDSRSGGFPFSHLLAPLSGLIQRSPWLVWAGAGFAALCAMGLIAMALHRGPKAIPAAVQSAPVQSESASVQPAPVQPALVQAARSDTSGAPAQKSPVASPVPALPGEHAGKAKAPTVKAPGSDSAKARPAKEPAEAAKTSESTEFCGGAPVDRILKRAEDSMNAGKFSAAKIDYEYVLKCDRNNARANSGLERLRKGEQFQRR